MDDARKEAEHFIRDEREFHLGALPTEQSHPKTAKLSEIIPADTSRGIKMLQTVDEDILPMARRIFKSREYHKLAETLLAALINGKKICLSGCGATGRLSILLETAWRMFWQNLFKSHPGLGKEAGRAQNAVISIMTGGDYALVSSVESFEDYQSFGRQQALEAGLGTDDVLVAITEGGETSSVIGTVWHALEKGAKVFFICNNPLDILSSNIERSRQIIQEPRIIKLDISTGPMAIAGSTRMQATTSELLIVGAALETALARYLQKMFPKEYRKLCGRKESSDKEYEKRFGRLLADLADSPAVSALAEWVETEEELYRSRNAITYFADSYLLDIFTDTTERSPTFMLPPFRKSGDVLVPRSWAFVKNPLYPTPDTWRHMLGRLPRCLAWNSALYRKLGAAEKLRRNSPKLDEKELFLFLIGNEDDVSRYSSAGDCAALVMSCAEYERDLENKSPVRKAFNICTVNFTRRVIGLVGGGKTREEKEENIKCFHIPCRLPASPLCLWDHLAVKLTLNTLSTATMARLGRVAGNWMVHVDITNKKLIDRGTRLVAEQCGLSYEEACYELHKTRAEFSHRKILPGMEKRSSVSRTIERLKGRKVSTHRSAF